MRCTPTGHRHQRGVALLTAVLVAALATVLAVETLRMLNLNLSRSNVYLQREQARQFALGAEEWARQILFADVRDAGGNKTVDSLEDNWAQRLPPLPVEDGFVEGFVEDAQGRFNLNNLVDPESGEKNEWAYEQFQRLLEYLELNPALADPVVDWIDPDRIPELQGAEDDFYTGLNPPYRAANYWFVTPTELLAVAGFDDEIYDILAPHVTALPPLLTGFRALNVNTATEAVLASLGQDLPIGDAQLESWLDERPVDDVSRLFGAGTTTVNQEILLGVTTGYFLLNVTVTLGTQRLTMYSLFERNGPAVTTRLRSFGTD